MYNYILDKLECAIYIILIKPHFIGDSFYAIILMKNASKNYIAFIDCARKS